MGDGVSQSSMIITAVMIVILYQMLLNVGVTIIYVVNNILNSVLHLLSFSEHNHISCYQFKLQLKADYNILE